MLQLSHLAWASLLPTNGVAEPGWVMVTITSWSLALDRSPRLVLDLGQELEKRSEVLDAVQHVRRGHHLPHAVHRPLRRAHVHRPDARQPRQQRACHKRSHVQAGQLLKMQ